MDLKDILQFQFKRVNPFQGLMIDTDIWLDAHNYHRDQQRLHTLVFHKVGIVQGLEVTSNKPPDLSVNIHPGIAIDSEGNVILVPVGPEAVVELAEDASELLGAPLNLVLEPL